MVTTLLPNLVLIFNICNTQYNFKCKIKNKLHKFFVDQIQLGQLLMIIKLMVGVLIFWVN